MGFSSQETGDRENAGNAENAGERWELEAGISKREAGS
jgi:hypothetical protein